MQTGSTSFRVHACQHGVAGLPLARMSCLARSHGACIQTVDACTPTALAACTHECMHARNVSALRACRQCVHARRLPMLHACMHARARTPCVHACMHAGTPDTRVHCLACVDNTLHADQKA
eukprot:366162-Chlamydomonas_euryale.AAC.2